MHSRNSGGYGSLVRGIVGTWVSWPAALIAAGLCVWAFRIRSALARPHDSLYTGSSSQ